MFGNFETILTNVTLGISIVIAILFGLRFRYIFKYRDKRICIWDKQVPTFYTIIKIIFALSLIFLVQSVIYNLFVVLLPTSVIRDYAKLIFMVLFSCWIIFEVYFSFSIEEKLFNGKLLKIILYSLLIIITVTANVYLFPNIIESLPFPADEKCLIIDFPLKGTWLTGHAGVSELTNSHTSNKYAIDFLKLDDNNRFYQGNEESVWDFYSFNAPVYSPVTGKVTEVVDHMESDSLGIPDRENLGGNYIIIDAGNNKFIYMAHLRKNSIVVKAGDYVTSGEYIARVGNSGNTTLPHLHIHVQNRPTAEREGRITYPFRFRRLERLRILGWFGVENASLLRNDRVRY